MHRILFSVALCGAACADKDQAQDTGTEHQADTGDTDCIPTTETCNGLDDDCDGEVDEDATDATLWFTDSDGDGFGQDGTDAYACSEPDGASAQAGDCDDSNAAVHPGADEQCNEVDDDCDDEIDEDVVDAELAYTDADGDGYGDPATVIALCPFDDSYVRNGDDCDDADASVHPAATERCNAIDDDCDPSTSEDGTALWYPADGSSAQEWTDSLQSGKSKEAAVIVIEEPGRLDVCSGTWETTFRVRAAFELVGMGSGPDEVVFDGTALQGVVIARTDTGADVSIQNLTLSNGLGVGAVLGEFTAGGGIECVGERTLTLEDVVLTDNEADVGAGVFVDGCTVQGSQVELHDNHADHYGGGLAVLSGSVSLDTSDLYDNSADFGGGLAVVDLDESGPAVSLENSSVSDNTAAMEGGGAVLEGGALTCLNGSVLANTSSQAGGVLLDASAELVSDVCDWGEPGTSDDNDPSDVRVLFEDYEDYGSSETFTCDEEGCR